MSTYYAKNLSRRLWTYKQDKVPALMELPCNQLTNRCIMPKDSKCYEGKLSEDEKQGGSGQLLFYTWYSGKEPCKLTGGQRAEGSQGGSHLDTQGKAPRSRVAAYAKALGREAAAQKGRDETAEAGHSHQ